jgi:hypothetical protein
MVQHIRNADGRRRDTCKHDNLLPRPERDGVRAQSFVRLLFEFAILTTTMGDRKAK